VEDLEEEEEERDLWAMDGTTGMWSIPREAVCGAMDPPVRLETVVAMVAVAVVVVLRISRLLPGIFTHDRS
jgi:hypothetical protein